MDLVSQDAVELCLQTEYLTGWESMVPVILSTQLVAPVYLRWNMHTERFVMVFVMLQLSAAPIFVSIPTYPFNFRVLVYKIKLSFSIYFSWKFNFFYLEKNIILNICYIFNTEDYDNIFEKFFFSV